MIPESFIQQLLARVDVVSLIERHIPLKKAGANYSACCPFHNEKSPSFTVSPSKQFYHCFGCGAHGSAIGFLMEYSGLGFVAAVEELAASVGLDVPQQHPAQRQQTEQKQPLTERMLQAARYYRDQLKAHPPAIDYLKNRGLSGEIAARFGLGYAPSGWQQLASIFPDYAKSADLAACGLVIDNDQGRRYDRFRERIMFPILDQRSNVIGFGGRILEQGEPKYLNSPETPLFEKGRELYGLTQARRAIRDLNAVIIVEGYMDVVALAQAGVENVVASLGTATTGHHLEKLLRMADRVIFCFDRDAAGDKAAWRAVETSLEHLADGKSVEILQLPGNQDPDEFIRSHGQEAFLAETRQATRLSEFLIKNLSRQSQPYNAEGRAQLVRLAAPLLQRIQAPVLRVQLTRALAELAQLSQAELETSCNLRPLNTRRNIRPQYAPRPATRSLNQHLLEYVLQCPPCATQIPTELIQGPTPEEAALRALQEAHTQGQLSLGSPDQPLQLGQLLEFFRNSEHEPVLSGYSALLASTQIDIEALNIEFTDALQRLQQSSLTQEINALTQKERQGGLNVEERQRYAQLLARKANVASAGKRS